jgi:hypothetical protein
MPLPYVVVDRGDQPFHHPTAWTNRDQEPHGGGLLMRRVRALAVVLLCTALGGGWVSRGSAGAPQPTPVKQYTGQIKSIKIEKCGLQPGTCEGAVILAQPGGQEVTLAILPGTWLKRGDQLVLIDELGVGNYVTAQATPLPATAPREGTVGSSPGERTITLEDVTSHRL